MRTFTHRWPQSGHFFSKLRHFFPILEKGQGRIPPPSPSSYARVLIETSHFEKKSWESFHREFSFNKAALYGKKQSPRCVLWKKVFLEISQNLQDDCCSRVSFLIWTIKCWLGIVLAIYSVITVLFTTNLY